MLADAHEQARRARDALIGGVQFTDDRRQPVVIESTRFETVLPLVITLDWLGVSSRVWELARTGFLAPGEQHPTTMGLYDLELVCDLLHRPSRLLHYLTRRHTFNQIGGVVAMEEADLVMYYLDQGLYVQGDNPPQLTVLPSLTDPVDAYYFHQHGKRRTPAPKPTARLHPELDRIIASLEERRPGGWTAASCLLLDMSAKEQGKLGKRIRTMRKRSRTRRMPHDISLALDDPVRGLTVVTEANDDREQLKEYVETLAFKNKHLSRADTWSGIGIHANRREPFHFFLHDATPWEPDQELDQAIAEFSRHYENSGKTPPATTNRPRTPPNAV